MILNLKNKIKINDLCFSYGRKTIFDHYNLEIENGINVIWGANGSGKTTLFKMLASIFRPKSGNIFLNDISYKSSDIRKYISFIPQDFDVFPNIKVHEFLKFIAEVKYGYKKEKIISEIDRVSEITSISDFLKMKMKNLSGGMRQRVGIAQALIGDAIFIIADEPTSGLDPEHRNNFNMMLHKIPSDKIVLISTHIIEDIRDFYNDIIIISEGKNTFQGDYSALMSSLDKKVFETSIKFEELEDFENKYKILLKDYTNESIKIRAVSLDENIDEKQIVEQSLVDVWTYYR